MSLTRFLNEFMGERTVKQATPEQLAALMKTAQTKLQPVRLMALRMLGEVGGATELEQLPRVVIDDDPETIEALRTARDRIRWRLDNVDGPGAVSAAGQQVTPPVLIRHQPPAGQVPPPPPPLAPPLRDKGKMTQSAAPEATGELTTEREVRAAGTTGSLPALPRPAEAAEPVEQCAELPAIPAVAPLPRPAGLGADEGRGMPSVAAAPRAVPPKAGQRSTDG